MDLVSVIIPVYNVQKYVTQAIQSILDQTYKNLEIIVIDDCSTDSTYERVLCLQEKDNRLKVYKNEKNIKIAATLNKGISLSHGQFIARMDGDDISKLDRIEKKVKFLKKNRHISLVGCSL